MYITNGRVFGGTPNILIFWLFLDNLSISEQTIDRAINNSHRTIKLWFNEEKKFHLIFTTYQNYPLALNLDNYQCSFKHLNLHKFTLFFLRMTNLMVFDAMAKRKIPSDRCYCHITLFLGVYACTPGACLVAPLVHTVRHLVIQRKVVFYIDL